MSWKPVQVFGTRVIGVEVQEGSVESTKVYKSFKDLGLTAGLGAKRLGNPACLGVIDH
jgi:hypothetical protein